MAQKEYKTSETSSKTHASVFKRKRKIRQYSETKNIALEKPLQYKYVSSNIK